MTPNRFVFTFVFALAIAFLAAPSPVWAQGSFKSYKDWKSEKIQEASQRAENSRVRLGMRKNEFVPGGRTAAQDREIARGEIQLRSDEMAIEVARELTVSDYFAGYLTRQADKNAAIKAVAAQFSPEEVAELMAEYANSVFGSSNAKLTSPAAQAAPDAVK